MVQEPGSSSACELTSDVRNTYENPTSTLENIVQSTNNCYLNGSKLDRCLICTYLISSPVGFTMCSENIVSKLDALYALRCVPGKHDLVI